MDQLLDGDRRLLRGGLALRDALVQLDGRLERVVLAAGLERDDPIAVPVEVERLPDAARVFLAAASDDSFGQIHHGGLKPRQAFTSGEFHGSDMAS